VSVEDAIREAVHEAVRTALQELGPLRAEPATAPGAPPLVYTPEEFGRHFGLAARTVREMLQNGEIPYIEVHSKRVIAYEDAVAYIQRERQRLGLPPVDAHSAHRTTHKLAPQDAPGRRSAAAKPGAKPHSSGRERR
jgi:hypothetical protein